MPQSVNVRHRKRRPGTRIRIRGLNFTCQHPSRITSQNDRLRTKWIEILQERRLVFISHANPEDNEFTSWLGTRLTAAGYEVWADVFRLIAGEVFWRDIGEGAVTFTG